MFTQADVKKMVKDEYHNEKNIIQISLLEWGKSFEETLDERMEKFYQKLEIMKDTYISKEWFMIIVSAMSLIFLGTFGFLFYDQIKTKDDMSNLKISINENVSKIDQIKVVLDQNVLDGKQSKDAIQEVLWNLKNRFK
jgi:hypothetical protein